MLLELAIGAVCVIIFLLILYFLMRPRKYRTHFSVQEYKDKKDHLTEVPENNLGEEYEEEQEEEEEDSSSSGGFNIGSLLSLAVGLVVVLGVGSMVMGQVNEALNDSSMNLTDTAVPGMMNAVNMLVPLVGVLMIVFFVLGAFGLVGGSDSEPAKRTKKIKKNITKKGRLQNSKGEKKKRIKGEEYY